MRFVAICLVLLTCTLAALAGGPTLPKEWREPTEAEKNGGGRKEHSIASLVHGDFDGDGLADSALLAISKDGKTEALLVVMFPAGKEKWFVLDRSEFDGTLFMGVEKYKPGTYQVLCTTDHQCEAGYKRPVTFANDTIVYYRPESASSIFVWNSKKKTFDRIWESD